MGYLPPQHAYDTQDSTLVCALSTTVGGVCAGRRESEVCAVGYVPPSGPGWWDDIDQGDLSDEGDDVFSVESGTGTCQAYHACVRVQTPALKAAVLTKYSNLARRRCHQDIKGRKANETTDKISGMTKPEFRFEFEVGGNFTPFNLYKIAKITLSAGAR